MAKKIRKQRRYATDFKKQIVKEFESGKYTVKELSRLHGIHPQTIYDWIYKYSTVNEKGYRVVEITESSERKVKALEERIKELERALGRKQIQLDYCEKLIELASEEYGIDIKKNSDTPPFSGFGSTKKNSNTP